MSYQYRDSHYKDKTVLQLSYLYKGNPHIWKDRLYINISPSAAYESENRVGIGSDNGMVQNRRQAII